MSTQVSVPPLAAMAARLNVDEQAIQNIVVSTLVAAKNNQQPTNEEFVTFLAIANEYKLNPLTKEIHAFSNRGKVQVIVSIDGWLKIINSHPQFDGLETVENMDANGNLISVTAKIFHKNRTHPTVVSERLAECQGTSEPWKKYPARMLRHKAVIQCARYAFGFSDIIDADEAERIEASVEKDVTPTDVQKALGAAKINAAQKQQLIDAAFASGKDETFICQVARVSNIDELEQARFEGCLNYLKGLGGQSE